MSNDTDTLKGSLKSLHCQAFDCEGKNATALGRNIKGKRVGEEKKKFKCSFSGCDYRCDNACHLRFHFQRRHAENRDQVKAHFCDQCDFKAFSKQELQRHTLRHSDNRPFVCDFPLCHFRTKYQDTLNVHKKRHDPDQDKLKVHSCTFCGYRTRLKSNLVCHIRIHTGDKPFACDFPGCNYSAAEPKRLRLHCMRHDPELMFKCDFSGCEFGAPSRQRLKAHQVTHNPDRKRDLQCPLCPNKLVSKASLNSHIRLVHTKEQPVGCSSCDSTFVTMGGLRLHTAEAHPAVPVGMDTILKKHKCTACDYSHKFRIQVVKHQQRAHSCVKNFACDDCDYRAKCKGDLKLHQDRCHRLEPRHRSFECPICNKKFMSRGSLYNHLNCIHRTDNLYKCHQCEFATKYAKCLRHHIESQHEENLTKSGVGVGQIRPVGGRRVRKVNRGRKGNGVAFNDVVGSVDELTFKCEFPGCHFVTTARKGLRRHEVLHRPEMQNIPCPMCPKMFFFAYTLKRHITIHAKEKPFKCDLCEYSATNGTAVRTHKRSMHACKMPPRSSDGGIDENRGKLVPPEQLGVTQIFSCPFCSCTHNEYMAIVRHTVTHRVAVVTLEKKHLICQ